MIKTKTFNFLIRYFSEQVIKDAYFGLLGRNVDSEGLTAYSTSLKNSLGLAALLADLANSDEGWQRSLNAHSASLIHILFDSLLNRAPETEALNNYADKLTDAKALAEIIAEIAHSEEHWNKLYSARAPGLVNNIFQGLLNREAEPDALENYASKLADTQNLIELLSTISESEEHWQKLFYDHSSDLVRIVFKGLLGREPESDAQENYTNKLAKPNDLSALLDEISNSDEHKARYFKFRSHAIDLIDAVYQGLLSRPADSSGIANYAKNINSPSDLANIISSIKESDEFISTEQKKRTSSTISNESFWGRRADFIDSLYHRYKDRPVFANELAEHISREEPIWEIHRGLLKCFTQKNKRPRVLIFGAYGNGNLGDVYQALAVREHLKSAWGLEDADIFACSLLESSDYPFPENQKLPSKSIFDYDLVNSFDCLVIGGGGLLAHPHDPLPDENWVKKIITPIILLGIGASNELLPQHKTLLEHSLYVSARDAVSIAAIKTMRSDVVYVPDPILSISFLDTMIEFDQTIAKPKTKIDILWILKYPGNDSDKKILASIQARIKNDSDKIHTIVAIEPKLDKVLDDYFQDIQVVYIDTLSELLSYIKSANIVFSMRYHGAIFSLLMKRRTFGSSQSKIQELFSEIDGHNAYIEHSDDINKVLKTGGIDPDTNHLAKMQLQFKDALMAFKLPR